MNTISYVSIVESKGWSLYDVSTPELGTESWDERQARREPVKNVQEGHSYLFAPQPSEGQSLRSAYAETGGVGPCLRISDVNSPEYKTVALMFSPRLAVFTRFVIDNSEVVFYTPSSSMLPECDYLVLNPNSAHDTFARDFDIITPDEFYKEINYANQEWRVTGS